MAMRIKISIVKESGNNEIDTGLEMNREIFSQGIVAKINEQILLASKLTKRRFTQAEIIEFVKVGIANKFGEFAKETQHLK